MVPDPSRAQGVKQRNALLIKKKILLGESAALWGTHWALRTGTASHEPTGICSCCWRPEGQTVSGVDSWPLERLAQTVGP